MPVRAACPPARRTYARPYPRRPQGPPLAPRTSWSAHAPYADTREGRSPPHRVTAPLASCVPARYWARSKSMALYARSFDRRCVESILRMVPDFERMTSEEVVAVSER